MLTRHPFVREKDYDISLQSLLDNCTVCMLLQGTTRIDLKQVLLPSKEEKNFVEKSVADIKRFTLECPDQRIQIEETFESIGGQQFIRLTFIGNIFNLIGRLSGYKQSVGLTADDLRRITKTKCEIITKDAYAICMDKNNLYVTIKMPIEHTDMKEKFIAIMTE